MKKPLIVGPVFTEIVNYVDELPKGNEEFTANQSEQRIAGNGYHLARMFQAFGFPYELLASVGTGTYGDFVKDACQKDHIILHEKEQISGCQYTLIDAKGQEGLMSVPGAEFAFDLEDIQYIDPQDISFVVLFGEMLTGDNAADLLQALDDLQKPVIFVPGNRWDEIDEDLLYAVFQFEPKIFLTDNEAFFIAGGKTKNMRDTAETLHEQSSEAVMIYQPLEGIYYLDSEDTYLVQAKKKIRFDQMTAGYIAAVQAGIDTHRALQYGVEFAEECRGKQPSANLMEMEKSHLAEMILGK